MSTCTFFGHRQVPSKTEPVLRSVLIDLIENRGVNLFYVGNQGEYDTMVQRVLKDLSTRYEIKYYVVFAYMPGKKDERTPSGCETVFPEGIETVPRRFAIGYRNKWMIGQSDFVVTCVTREIGSGAAKFKALAIKKQKTIVELSL